MQRFDTLTRALAAAAPRRGLLAGLAGGLVAASLPGLSADEAGARKNGKRKKRKSKKKGGPAIKADATCAGESVVTRRAFIGNERLAQSFTTTRGGPLVKVRLPIGKDLDGDEGGDFVLRLSPLHGSGIPTDEVLAEAVVASDAVPEVSDDIDVFFPKPFPLVAGNDYALVLSRPNGDGFIWRQHADNRCDGAAFASAGQTEPFAATGALFDLIFTTFVKT